MSALLGQAPDHPRPRATSRLPRFAESAVERARLTVVPRRQTTAPRVPFFILVAIVLLGGVVGLLLFNTSMQQASFKVTALEAEAARLHAVEQALQMEVDELRDPQLVASRATKLGMVPLRQPAFLRLPDGDILGKPVPVSPEDAQRLEPLPARKPPSLRPTPVRIVVSATPDTGADGVPSDEQGSPSGTTVTGR